MNLLKHCFLGCVVLSASVGSLFGQGQIVFQNGSSTAITNSATGQRAITNTMVGLYVNGNSAATSSSPGWSIQAKTNLVAPGLFFGGVVTTTFPAGTPVAVQVRAWLTATPYSTYEA